MVKASTSSEVKDLPLVPESVLRKRHNLDDLARKRKALLEVGLMVKKKRIGGESHFYIKKPESFIARARQRHNGLIRYSRVRRLGMHKRASSKPLHTTKEIRLELEDDGQDDGQDDKTQEQDNESSSASKVAVKYQTNSVNFEMVFVIRIRNHQGLPKPVSATLNGQLNLRSIHQGVFVRYTPHMRAVLHTVEPYVVYGPPSLPVIADLIERRGFARGLNSAAVERIPLSDNTIIEERLGKWNILCKEDLVQELFSVGEAFDEITRHFLFPFQLIDSKTKFERQTLKLKDGKDYGDRGEEINDYIQQIL